MTFPTIKEFEAMRRPERLAKTLQDIAAAKEQVGAAVTRAHEVLDLAREGVPTPEILDTLFQERRILQAFSPYNHVIHSGIQQRLNRLALTDSATHLNIHRRRRPDRSNCIQVTRRPLECSIKIHHVDALCAVQLIAVRNHGWRHSVFCFSGGISLLKPDTTSVHQVDGGDNLKRQNELQSVYGVHITC